MSIEISIIIPIYNVETYIYECLQSVKKAIEDLSAEVILVDDGSTDGSSEIAMNYAEREHSFLYYRKENGGPGDARNYGMDIAKGKYIAFVDPDDIVEANHYKLMLNVARKHKCDMVISDTKRIKGTNLTYSSLHRRTFYNVRDLNISMEKNPLLIFDATVYNRIILRKLLKKSKIRFPEGYRYEDYPFVQELHYFAKKIRFVRNWGYIWRIRTDGTLSITRSHQDTRNLTDKIDTLEMLRRFMVKHRASKEYMRLLDYKILFIEFNGTIDALKDIPEEKAKEHLEIAANYIENNVNLDVMEDLPIYDRQKIDYILKRDLYNLLRLMNYKAINYDSAAVIQRGNEYEVELPADLFPVQYRNIKNEHAKIPFYQAIDTIEDGESKIDIHAHVYLRRVNAPNLNSQTVKSALVNYAEDGEMPLDTVNELRPSLTDAVGTVVSSDDYVTYHYNYDGTGVCVTLDLEKISSDDRFKGRNYVLIECDNAIGHSEQLLRYASKKTKEKLKKGIEKVLNERIIRVALNDIDVFEVSVEDKK